MLNQRLETVLTDLVDIHSETGQPVGSKALCDRSELGLSSASIRNVMAELEEQGYLTSPHTSAGRQPTEVGFRYYVKSIVGVGDLDEELKNSLQKQVEGKSFKQSMSDVTNLLGEITGCAGLVTAPRQDRTELEQVEFIRLSGGKVLAVMISQDGDVENRMVEVPDYISIDELNKSAMQMKDMVQGKTLSDARVAMMGNLMEEKNKVDNLMAEMMAAAETWAEPSVSDGALVVSGTQNLFQYPELVRDQLKSMFHAFEEKRMIMALMNEVQKGEGVQVFIGEECPFKDASACSMITTSYGAKNKKNLGTLGIIGPMRMNYRQTIQLVDYTGKILSRVLEKN